MNWVFKRTGAMTRVALLTGLALLWAAPFAPAMPARPIRIVSLGTSLTQGYGLPPGTELTALLQAKLKAAHVDATVINAGVSGDTSAGGLARLGWSLADNPDAAIVEFGGNDALRGLAPSETEKNLSAILAELKARRIPALLLGMMAPRNLGPEYSSEFDAIYPRLAAKYGVLFYPFVLNGVAMDARLNQADGIHPNPAGEKVVADRIFPDVLKLARAAQKGTR
jgi:acyl-CoA thioesterase-1